MRNMSVPTKASMLALAAALVAGPSPAAAQSLQGTPSVSSGSANISEGTGTTTVTLNTGQTVIDWVPDDNAVGNFGAINFQPSGTTATFQNNPDLVGDFAVLNRIGVADQSRIVALNGRIDSLVNGQTGGSVFFYSPSGFVITGTAVINVGSLVLSASPIAVDGNGNFISNNSVVFNQAPNPNAAINTVSDINGTAQINSSGSGNYVALVAPRINHQGDIRVDGSAALVAAEAATINFNPFGLFDIQVDVGTDDANGISVDGGTIGRNSAAVSSDNIHRAYLVAVAKNDAVTMVINNGASIGFEIANSATVEDNAVILSGGYDVGFGDHAGTSGTSSVNAFITNATLSTSVDAQFTGNVAINSSQGALTFGGDLTVIGGETSTTGGNVLIDGQNGNALTIGGDLYARAARRNADGSETGLITRLGATGGSTVTVGGDVRLDSDSFGTTIGEFGETGTNATGGNAQVNIGANSTLNVTGTINVHADGYGGSSNGNGTAGNGIGGQALVMAIGGNAEVTVGGSVFASASGFGGSTIECSICNVTGGNGVGGNASVHTNVGSGNAMVIAGDVEVRSNGQGGAGDAAAGNGFGTNAALFAGDNSFLSVGADVVVDANGYGGFGFNGPGGLGDGGQANITATAGGLLILSGPAFVTASGLGGEGGDGGDGVGGNAQVWAANGSVDFLSSIDVEAIGEGANAPGATGGDGTGGSAGFGTEGGTLTVAGDLTLNGSATGGSGNVGGDANALFSAPSNELTPIAASIYVNGGGAVQIDGTATLSGSAIAGAGSNGAGGDAQGGEADVVAYVGSIGIGTLDIDVNGLGGSGGQGGAGGSGGGGAVDVAFGYQAAALDGTITIGSATIDANGVGGAGGAGTGANTGGAGGTGGFGFGGDIIYAGSAGGGTLISGAAVLNANGTGGAGGAGGSGDTGPGGNGGTGGSAAGGFIQTGTLSSELAPTEGGGASYTSLAISTNAVGGAGGNGGTGGGGAGTGGNGGNADGGSASFLARGVLVTADTVAMTANARGGNGGTGSTAGNGGRATTGFVSIESKDRFNHPDQRGTLEADSILAEAVAVGGTGAVNGTSTILDGSYFRVLNGDATIGTVAINLAGSTFNPASGPSLVSVRDGTATIGDFTFTTDGELALDASNGSMTAGTITLAAVNFRAEPSLPAPTVTGSYSADTFDISTAGNFVTNADLISTSTLVIDAPGLIQMAAATSGGDLALIAGSSITGGAQSAAGNVFATAPGNITLGNIVAGDSIDVISVGGNLSLGFLSAANFIYLEAGGNIGFGDATADDLEFDAGGNVTGGDIIAGTVAGGQAGGSVTLGDISVGIQQAGGATDDGFAVGIAAAGPITVGAVEADEAIGFATLGNLTTGALNSGTGVMTLIGGNTQIASIVTSAGGRVYHGDAQMFLDAGGPDNFDPSQVLSQPPVRSGGSYTVTGSITTGQLQVAAASIGTGNINAGDSVALDSAGSIATGAIDAVGFVEAQAGTSLTTGAIDAGDYIQLTAGTGAISIGNATAGANFQATAGGDLITRSLSAVEIEASAGGTAAIDGVWAADYVGLVSDDINITANGAINAAEIDLVSSNAVQTVVGDGVAGGGYQLSDAEYDRLGSGDIDVIADAGLGAAPRILIGDLSVTAPSAGGSEYEFVTTDSQSETDGVVGSVRVVGDAIFTGMGADDGVAFSTNLFELDAATGTLSLENAPGTLGGVLYLDAAQIHVASGAILDRLANEPQYDGYQDELNAPAAVQRPEGVVRAGSIEIEFYDGGEAPLNTLYVQNTGTEATPAGFLIGEAALFGEPESEVILPPGSIDLVINGQIVTQAGTLTGVDVRDALVAAEGDLTPFTATSTINGCLLTGACSGPSGPFPPGFTPTPGIQDEITLVDDGLLPAPEFGNEDVIDDNIELTVDGATSPITPPTPLFDTSALGGKSDVEDPVSGSGNPALMESQPGDDACPAGGSQNGGQCKQEKQP